MTSPRASRARDRLTLRERLGVSEKVRIAPRPGFGDRPIMLCRATLALALFLCACGARTGLPGGEERDGGGGQGGSGGNDGGGGEAPKPCNGVPEEPCGTDVGECSPGVRRCQADGFFGPCEGDIGPFDELCNDLDDDCDGTIDNGFGLGEACDGADNDVCLDDVRTCGGCSLGPDILEVCNGFDDNCNGTVDADCDVGDCSPSLLVTGSTPSSPNCVDFPVEAGSTGTINYPCTGGEVSATLGQIEFTGSVTNGQVSLMGTEIIIGPDGCQWQNDHFITGSIPDGTLEYFYQETLLTMPPFGCWNPCTEVGTVEIHWTRKD